MGLTPRGMSIGTAESAMTAHIMSPRKRIPDAVSLVLGKEGDGEKWPGGAEN